MTTPATKAEVGFLKPTERDRCAICRHCGHADNGRDGPWEHSWIRCVKHGFPVVPGGAICDHFERRPERTPPPAVTDAVIGDLFDVPPAEI